jgi:hypothetical protein
VNDVTVGTIAVVIDVADVADVDVITLLVLARLVWRNIKGGLVLVALAVHQRLCSVGPNVFFTRAQQVVLCIFFVDVVEISGLDSGKLAT